MDKNKTNAETQQSAAAENKAPKMPVLTLEREGFFSKKYNREMYSHFVRVKLRNQEKKIRFMPPDNGGYEVLDLVFGDGKTANLYFVPWSMTDDKTGEIKEGFSYSAENVEDGVTYSCKLRLHEKSDQDLMRTYLSTLPA